MLKERKEEIKAAVKRIYGNMSGYYDFLHSSEVYAFLSAYAGDLEMRQAFEIVDGLRRDYCISLSLSDYCYFKTFDKKRVSLSMFEELCKSTVVRCIEKRPCSYYRLILFDDSYITVHAGEE